LLEAKCKAVDRLICRLKWGKPIGKIIGGVSQGRARPDKVSTPSICALKTTFLISNLSIKKS